MPIISYFSLSLSPLGVVHVGTAAYTSCLERGGEGENKTTAKKREPLPIWSHDKNVVPDTSVEQGEQVKRYLTARKEQYRKRLKLLLEHTPSLFVLLHTVFLLRVFRYVYFL
jgi:hypothetical protein